MVLIVHFLLLHVLQKPGQSTPHLFLKLQGTVSFDNIPFSLEEVRILDGQYGEHILLKKERKGAKHCDFKAEERLAVRPRLGSNGTPQCHAYPDHALPT